jgi:hypothetical protein
MTNNTPILSLLTALLAVGCTEDEKVAADDRSAIILTFDAEADAIQAVVAELKVVLNHEVPYSTDTTKVSEWMDLRDFDGDGDVELIINVDPNAIGEGELPMVELRPGENTSPFTISVTGLDTAIGRAALNPINITVLSSADLGPLEFTDEVQSVEIGLRVLTEA